jgi:hypothetical protein
MSFRSGDRHDDAGAHQRNASSPTASAEDATASGDDRDSSNPAAPASVPQALDEDEANLPASIDDRGEVEEGEDEDEARSPAPTDDRADTADTAPAEPSMFRPSEAWIAAFEREYQEAMAHLVLGYAAKRGLGVGPPPVTKLYPRDLVFDAVTDTLTGEARWNPNTKPLEAHLRAVIRRRTAIEWRQAHRHPHHSIDEITADGRTPIRDEADRVLARSQPDPRAAGIADEALNELRLLADSDPELIAYIEALAHGASRTELMRMTGLSIARYRKVRRRLSRLVGRVSIQAGPVPTKRGTP